LNIHLSFIVLLLFTLLIMSGKNKRKSAPAPDQKARQDKKQKLECFQCKKQLVKDKHVIYDGKVFCMDQHGDDDDHDSCIGEWSDCAFAYHDICPICGEKENGTRWKCRGIKRECKNDHYWTDCRAHHCKQWDSFEAMDCGCVARGVAEPTKADLFKFESERTEKNESLLQTTIYLPALLQANNRTEQQSIQDLKKALAKETQSRDRRLDRRNRSKKTDDSEKMSGDDDES
jgi:hypothetical protein